MRIGLQVKKQIAYTIGKHFTTKQIVDIFSASNIHTDESLYAKWKITLDAFNKISNEETFFYILNEFSHPLNFKGWDNPKEQRLIFIKEIQKALEYEDIGIKINEKSIVFVNHKNSEDQVYYEPPVEPKTSTDYIVDAINFFKNEYNKIRLPGLIYDYSLGENISSNFIENGRDKYDEKLRAINTLKSAGLITWYDIDERTESDCPYPYIWDYARCKIDENKLIQKEQPRATDAGVQQLTKKIIHEHTHRFENSIQEKEINLNQKIINEQKSTDQEAIETSLKSAKISYDDDKATIKINDQSVALPPYKNEHYLCRAMYEHKKDEVIDWSTIWEKMVGYDTTPDKPEAKKDDWRMVYDAMNAINSRIKECANTNDNLFIWKDKTIKRNY